MHLRVMNEAWRYYDRCNGHLSLVLRGAQNYVARKYSSTFAATSKQHGTATFARTMVFAILPKDEYHLSGSLEFFNVENGMTPSFITISVHSYLAVQCGSSFSSLTQLKPILL